MLGQASRVCLIGKQSEMGAKARPQRSALETYWRELAAEARAAAEGLPEGEAKRLRDRAVAHYENLAKLAASSAPPEED